MGTVTERMWFKIPFKLPLSIYFLVVSALLTLAYFYDPTDEHLIGTASWLFLTLAHILGSLSDQFKSTKRIVWFLAIGSSLISFVTFVLWFVLTLEPPYIFHFLFFGFQFYFIPNMTYNLIRIR